MPITSLACPVQALQFGRHLTLVALGGEVAVDYGLEIKREFPKQNVVVAGYSNDVMAYIPTQKILREGGYEAAESMALYGLPGPFTNSVEKTILKSVREAIRAAKGPAK
jgi:hypothetical protein